ncbi:MAG: hypothetical protein ACOXZR_04485 [Bacilli bacterium]|jgi:hypothetical protein
MNNKGVILSGLIYSLLTFFLLLLASILLILWHRQSAVDLVKEEAERIQGKMFTGG